MTESRILLDGAIALLLCEKDLFRRKYILINELRSILLLYKWETLSGYKIISHIAYLTSKCMLYLCFQVLFKVIFNFICIVISKLHCIN